jgi:hypothetical protein
MFSYRNVRHCQKDILQGDSTKRIIALLGKYEVASKIIMHLAEDTPFGI